MDTHLLRLYVAGDGSRSQRIALELERICKDAFGDRYELEVIDVLRDPALAEQDHILATPTLVRVQPPPRLCIIGDLHHREKVLQALDILPSARDAQGQASDDD